MSRHQPAHGADSAESLRESFGPTDSMCDHCGTVSAYLYRYPLSGKRNYLCATCAVRESGEPACSWCQRPTFGDYRAFAFTHDVSIVCGVCSDKADSEWGRAS